MSDDLSMTAHQGRTTHGATLVGSLARLARIGLTKGEEDRYEKQLPAIVDFVGQVERVQAELPLFRATISGVTHVVRSDTAEPSALADALLKQVPETRNRFVKVPVIF